MAVGTVVLLAAASLLGKVGQDYGRISGGVGTEREARAALQQLAADAATARPHPQQLFEAGAGGWPRDRLGFFTLQPAIAQSEDGRLGDLCAVNYYLKDLPVGGVTVRCLMRGFRESADTFDALRAGDPSTLFAAGSRDEPVAFGVAGFEARPVERAADGSWRDWSPPAAGASTGEFDGPDAVRVRLVVVRRELLGKLTTTGDWDGGGAGGRLLGRPEDAQRSNQLQVFESIVRFGQP